MALPRIKSQYFTNAFGQKHRSSDEVETISLKGGSLAVQKLSLCQKVSSITLKRTIARRVGFYKQRAEGMRDVACSPLAKPAEGLGLADR